MTDLEEITRELDTAYQAWKGGESDKNTAKKKFFSEVEKLLALEHLSEHYEMQDAPTIELARTRLEQRFPERLVDDIRPISPGASTFEAIMVENPALKPYSYVNRETGVVFQRQVSQGSVYVDDERLQAEDPELWKRATQVPYEEWVKEAFFETGCEDVDAHFEWALTHIAGAPERRLKDFAELSDEDRGAIMEYVYYGKPTVKLAPPRPARAEELG